MFKRLALAVAGGAVGYVIGAAGGYLFVNEFSPNSHNRAVVAAMTGFLIIGPICALISLAISFARAGRKPPRP